MQLPRRVALKDLRGRRWVLCPDDCGYRRALEHRLYGAAQSLDVAAAIWGFASRRSSLPPASGLGLLPEQVIAESADADRLQVLEVADFSAALDLWLVRSQRRRCRSASRHHRSRGARPSRQARSQSPRRARRTPDPPASRYTSLPACEAGGLSCGTWIRSFLRARGTASTTS